MHVPALKQAAARVDKTAPAGTGRNMPGEQDGWIRFAFPALDQSARDAGVAGAAMRHHDALGLCIYVKAARVSDQPLKPRDAVGARGFARRLRQHAGDRAHLLVDRYIEPGLEQHHGELWPSPVGRHWQKRGTARQNLEDAPVLQLDRLLGVAIGAVEDHGWCRRRRVDGVDARLERIVAHVEQPVTDGEAQPDPAGRVPISAGLDLDAKDLAVAADRDGVAGDVFQARQHGRGRKDLRPSDPIKEPQGPDVIVMAMAQHHCIDASDPLDIGQAAGLGPLAAIEQQAASVRLDHEGGGLLRPQTGGSVETCAVKTCAHGFDNLAGQATFRMMKPSRTATATAAPTAGGALAYSTRSCGASAALGWMVSTVAAPW